jgi:hypothetical protein
VSAVAAQPNDAERTPTRRRRDGNDRIGCGEHGLKGRPKGRPYSEDYFLAEM